VYGHYGSEADMLVLQAKKIQLKNRILLLRMGKLSLAEKVCKVVIIVIVMVVI
jgi:cell division protein FtsL